MCIHTPLAHSSINTHDAHPHAHRMHPSRMLPPQAATKERKKLKIETLLTETKAEGQKRVVEVSTSRTGIYQ